jgi:uncharacterized protein HemY
VLLAQTITVRINFFTVFVVVIIIIIIIIIIILTVSCLFSVPFKSNAWHSERSFSGI